FRKDRGSFVRVFLRVLLDSRGEKRRALLDGYFANPSTSCNTVLLTTARTTCGHRPSRNINPMAGSTTQRSPSVRSEKPDHFGSSGPFQTRCRIVSRNTAVVSRPSTESVAAQPLKAKAP